MAFSEVLGQALVPIRADLEALKKDLQKAEGVTREELGKALDKAGKPLQEIGRNLTTFVTLPIVGATGAAVKLAGDFEYSMNVLKAVSGATGEQLEQLRKLAIDLGNDMQLPGTSAIDAAEAMTELIKAGVDVENTMRAARGVLVLSAAAQIENAEAAEIVANALNAFNLSGDKATYVADLLANAANAASGEITDMAYGLQQASAVAAMAGQDISDVVTALSLMANAGIQGSDAGTSLKQMFLSLINPTDKAKKLMREYGIELYTASGQLKPLPQLIEEFRTKLGALPPAQRNAALATIFGSDAIRAANIVLMAGTEEWNKMHAAVTKAGGAQEVAAAKMQGFRGAYESFKSTLETLAITLGTHLLPPLTKFFQLVAQGLDWVTNLPQPLQILILVLGGLAAAIGPVIFLLGSFMGALSNLITQGPVVLGALQTIRTAFLPLLPTIGAVGAALIAFVTIGYLVVKNWDSIKAWLINAWNAIKTNATSIWESIKTWLVTTWNNIRAQAEVIWGRVLQFIRELPGKAWTFLSTLPEKMGYWVMFAIGRVIKFFAELPVNVWNILKTMATHVGNWFRTAKDWAVQRVMEMYNSVRQWISQVPGQVSAWLSSLPGKISTLFNQAKDKAVTAARNLYNGFKEWVLKIPGVLGDVFTNIWNEIKTWPSKLWEKAKSIGRSMWEGFKAGLGISSPSYIERALMAIEEQARVTVAEMRSSVRELGRLTLPRPDVGPAMAMAGPGYGGARVVAPGWRGLGRPAWGAPVVEGRRVEVVLVLDGKELARKQLPYLLVEMAAANRDAKRAVGR